MDDTLLKHLPPYQLMLYKAYSPSITTEEFSLSSTNTNNNDASSVLSSSAAVTSTGSSLGCPQVGTDNFWFRRIRMNNQRLGGNSSIPLMKNFWENEAEKERIEAEKCIARHKLQRPFDFPKWRSSDAMSASLVATTLNTPNIIPGDSRLPQHRINKIHENEIKAQETKKLIQQENASTRPTRRTNFNTSLCLSPEDFNKQQWYDQEQIRSSIENDSIANIRETRSFFEQASQAADFKNQLIPRPFVADRAVLSPVPVNQTLSVQCQPIYSPHSQFPSPPSLGSHQNYAQQNNIYSQPQNGVNHHYQQQHESKIDNDQLINGRQMTFLEKEILEVARREREHQEHQKSLGHLTLEGTFELWRNGNDWNAAISRPQSSSGFHEFDNLDSGIENLTTSSNNN